MKRCIALMLSILLLMILGACGRQSEPPSVTRTPPVTESPSTVPQTESAQPQSTGESPAEFELSEGESAMTTITITIGSSVFSAKLYDNDTVTAYLAQLPMILNMSELNGNEKYNNLPDSLPTDSQQVGSINTGDLMLYGSDCLVLFYESFTTSYSYTKLGYIENASGLADALGRGSVQVSFSK